MSNRSASAARGRRLALALTAAASLAAAGPNVARFPADYRKTPAHHYAALAPVDCHAELDRRKIHYTRVADAPGVAAPVRIDDRLGGVLYRTDFPDSRRKKVPWEIFDCRLVLAMHDFSVLLGAHDIHEVRIFSGYRPPSKHWPKGKLARRHPGALAVDVRLFKKKNGEELVVSKDWTPDIGSDPCTGEALTTLAADGGVSAKERELRALLCEASDARIFHSMLTPNYDKAHFNHFHLEVTAGVRWFIAR